MESAYGRASHMLTGEQKKSSKCQSFKLGDGTATEIFFSPVDNYDEMINALDVHCAKHRSSPLWVNNLIKPVLRAEREGEWPMYQWAVKQMMPHFSAAGHFNYAKTVLTIYSWT